MWQIRWNNSDLRTGTNPFIRRELLFPRSVRIAHCPATFRRSTNLCKPRAHPITTDGDGRRFLNLVEQLANGAVAAGVTHIDSSFVSSASTTTTRRFDKGGEEFYDQISALIKSARGSNPDAALYWMARMIDGGVDVRFLARCIVILASEEVGNADPHALGSAPFAQRSHPAHSRPWLQEKLPLCA